MAVYGTDKHVDADFCDMEVSHDTHATGDIVVWHQLVARHTWSSPPARYNESSMVRLLEKEGIGRPSTYASIMTKLFEKQYVTKKDIPGKDCLAEHYVRKPHGTKKSGPGQVQKQKTTVTVGKENNKIIPTQIGIQIDAFLVDHFAYIVDKTFTAHMEEDLDKIAQAEKDKLQMLKTFWCTLEKDIRRTTQELKTVPKIKCEQEKNIIHDEEKGVKYTVREAKYGPVIAYELSNPATKKEAKYVPLKGYLATTKKDLFHDIHLDDIRFLQSFPYKIGMLNDGQEVWMAYGPYGFYVRIIPMDTPDKPIFVSLPQKTVQVYLNTKQIDLEDIRQALEHKLRSDKPEKMTAYPKKKYWGRKKNKNA